MFADLVAARLQETGSDGDALAEQVSARLRTDAPPASATPTASEPFRALLDAVRACGRVLGSEAAVARVVLLDANGKSLAELSVPAEAEHTLRSAAAFSKF